MLSYGIIDDGDGLQVQMFQNGEQVGGALLDLDALGDDAACLLAIALGETFKNFGGMGAKRPI